MGKDKERPMRPATTKQGREDQLIALATDLAEKQLREGTASSQIIAHYLKLGTMREQTEREILEEQKKLIKAKTEALKSQKHVEELYADALNAMRKYAGQEELVEDLEDDES